MKPAPSQPRRTFLATVLAIMVLPPLAACGALSSPQQVEWDPDALVDAYIREDYELAMKIVRRGVELGHPVALCNDAGGTFEAAENAADYAEAARKLKALDFKDCLRQTLYFAVMHLQGWGLEKDLRLVEHYVRKEVVFFGTRARAAEYGQDFVDRHYPVLAAHLVEAKRWWDEVAEKWSPEKQFQLALSYLQGEGAPRDSDMGYRILRLAARNGSQEAKTLLAEAVRDGKTEPYVPAESYFYWVRRLAHNDIRPDHRRLGFENLEGTAPRPTPEKAYIWLYAAKKRGAEDVDLALEQLEKELPPEVVRWARDWVDRRWWP
jgi:TPR repeat protein